MEKTLKIIFLDIDGVLNSVAYDRVRTLTEGNIDVSRLPLLKRIVDATGAQIVLSSTWRVHWDKREAYCDAIGRELNAVFQKAGLTIFDKTPVMDCRQQEITAWIDAHPQLQNFVILDDIFGGWGELEAHLVRTNSRIGRGLEEGHADAAIKILRFIGSRNGEHG